MGLGARYASRMRALGDRDWLEGVGDDEGERDPRREGRVSRFWDMSSPMQLMGRVGRVKLGSGMG